VRCPEVFAPSTAKRRKKENKILIAVHFPKDNIFCGKWQ
jgi:hypothetical protein